MDIHHGNHEHDQRHPAGEIDLGVLTDPFAGLQISTMASTGCGDCNTFSDHCTTGPVCGP